MCKKLVRELQSCPDAEYGCSQCEFQKTLNCRERLMKKAADAIEELNKRIDFLMNCIYEAEDSLDRGAHNDWARAALEKAERGQDDV